MEIANIICLLVDCFYQQFCKCSVCHKLKTTRHTESQDSQTESEETAENKADACGHRCSIVTQTHVSPIETPETEPHRRASCFLTMVPGGISADGAGKSDINLNLPTHIKINSKCIRDFNVKCKTIKLLGRKNRKFLEPGSRQ